MAIREDIKEYYSRKTTCPKCKSKDLAETAINILDLPKGKYVDNKNITVCLNCQWRGYVDMLKG